jgi:hypothetical protein
MILAKLDLGWQHRSVPFIEVLTTTKPPPSTNDAVHLARKIAEMPARELACRYRRDDAQTRSLSNGDRPG